jgi:prophage antirepressor-like protein
MENKIITKEYFSNEYITEITMIQDVDKVVWFKGIDVASILGYSDKKKAIRMHVDEDDKQKLNEIQSGHFVPPLNSQPHSVFINESGLYSLILRSKLEGVKKFQKWVTKEVLPSIRKSGSYSVKKEINSEKLREIQLKEIQILDNITDAKLKQAFLDRLMNEITGDKKETSEYSRDIITILKEEFNKTIDFSLAAKIGKYIVKQYRLKYNKEPEKYMKFVNGNNRPVFCYTKEEEVDLIEWIKKYL